MAGGPDGLEILQGVSNEAYSYLCCYVGSCRSNAVPRWCCPGFAADAAADAKGHCVGGNACKGQGACKTAKNECKGQNGCKGTSFTEATAADCAKIKDAKFEAPGAEKK